MTLEWTLFALACLVVAALVAWTHPRGGGGRSWGPVGAVAGAVILAGAAGRVWQAGRAQVGLVTFNQLLVRCKVYAVVKLYA